MIKVDENDPVGELQPSFPYRDVTIKRNVDVNDYYDLESEIGRGKFGTVYRCKEKSTGLTLAAKFVGIARRQDRRNVEREVEIMRTLQHPRLIQLYDAFESNSVMCVIQELIEGGELFERVIDDDFILTEKACTVFMRQICEGVEFIHSQNILHLDLKPENILCLTKTGNRIKIIDFGLARKFEPDKKLQVLFGTPEFVAPEVVNFEQIGFGTDMWSVGVICYVLLSGLSPFMGETDVETMANVTIAQYDFDDEAFDDISDDAKDFITKLLMKNKEHRLSATECLSHVWLRRKPPPPPPPSVPQFTASKQKIEIIPQPIADDILDNTKENLREFVDRWTEQGGTSPSKIVSVPMNEPFKEINDNSVKSLEVSDKNLIKDEVIPDNLVSRMDIDNISIGTNNQQKSTESLIENTANRNCDLITDATKTGFSNEIAGKKLKLDTTLKDIDNLTSFGNGTPLADNKMNVINNNKKDFLSPVKSQPSTCFIPSDDSYEVNTTTGNKNLNSLQSPIKSQPSSPIGTIPKTPSGSKLKFIGGTTEDSCKKPLYPSSVEQVIKPDVINSGTSVVSNILENMNHLTQDKEHLAMNITEQNKTINSSNVVGSKSNEAISKPPFMPNIGGINKPKLVHQFSVPNDLTKCKLNKNILAADSLPKLKELTPTNKSIKENTLLRTDVKNNVSSVDSKELGLSDGKFNKTLNKHVVPPKIHGIVLGQNDGQDSNESSVLAEQKGPKVITHKIFVEGRTDPILPPHVPSSINKENKKNENRTQKPISKSQTSSKLELKENSGGVKSKPITSRFFDNDRFDRRGSDISCFLHDRENLERTNLADEIKKLSSRLFQMGNNSTDDQELNNVITDPIPISSFRNDPIGRFLANHGVVTRRPKYRMSHLNRDVPLGSPPPASNLFYHLSHSNSGSWSDDQQTHSAPQSPSASPEREIGRLSKEVILRLFDKNITNNNAQQFKQEEKHPAMSSIDSLASYFKTNNEAKKNIPPIVTSK